METPEENSIVKYLILCDICNVEYTLCNSDNSNSLNKCQSCYDKQIADDITLNGWCIADIIDNDTD